MGHPGTDADVFDTLVAFMKSIGMVALPIKEQPGYIVNSLLVPLLVQD
jgi:3-hydroxybutyryl-CoA dehydrogenase